ncbi:MAG TPA: helix-turn-helix domain-containing protein [Puia sp.]|jgi:DNA-binding HxlR family transcriptional regulator|nr:helix-turn-helix domain-containing protein [Puia sp.]
MKKTVEEEHSACTNILRPVRDSLDVLSGKWKLPIIIALTFGEKRFTEITQEVHGITDRMLSKELRDLELNGLVKRNVQDTYPVKVTYALTAHSKTLRPVIDSLKNWGILHKKKLHEECREHKAKRKISGN